MKNGIIYHSSSTTPPPSPVTGTVYFDQTTALYKIYNGVGWMTLSGDECTEEMDPTGPIRELLASSVDIDDPFIAEVRDELIMRLKLITEFKTEPEPPTPWYSPAGLSRGLVTPQWCKGNDDDE